VDIRLGLIVLFFRTGGFRRGWTVQRDPTLGWDGGATSKEVWWANVWGGRLRTGLKWTCTHAGEGAEKISEEGECPEQEDRVCPANQASTSSSSTRMHREQLLI